MKISGFTFIRNAIENDYAIKEAILSILPICDEFIVAHGNSNDLTLELIRSIGSDKIRIIQTTWDDSLREGGQVFAKETDKAYAAIAADTDWAFYIQGDECIHEKYLPVIKQEMEAALADKNIEGLLFKYLHFYGSYDYTAVSRRWYRHEIRIVRYHANIHSYRDAQGFRLNDRKIRVKPIDAYVYHYGWVKPPNGLNTKVRNFNKYYHQDEWIETHYPESTAFDYSNAHKLKHFEGTHPAVLQERIKTCNWQFSFDPVALQKKMSLRYRLLQKLEDIFGIRIGEYKNYTIANR